MKIYDLSQLGARIKMLRRQRGMTQSDLARRVEVTRTCVTNWETGVREVDVRYWERLADVFGISIEILCGAQEVYDDVEHLDLSRLSKENRQKLVTYYCRLLEREEEENSADTENNT